MWVRGALVCAALTVAVVGQEDRQAAPRPTPRQYDPLELCSGGFSVRKADPSTATITSPPSKLKFQDVLTNLGGWSASESDFQAPCSGAYFFTFHALSRNQGDFTNTSSHSIANLTSPCRENRETNFAPRPTNSLALMKEGKYQVTAYGSTFDYQQGSNSALIFLNAGERVHLELQDGSLYEHPYDEAYTTFSGFLVEQF
ncbi:Complement C1q-like protein 4 [Portunus trituberculatus]|uniref:Complement C1q-like protein 4 n=1 Tax=Portunus trituberculatus TaxID=210409 RepID=A0A5B7EKP5_PORTR|nr:Complement C1q-like protein 4 [Portunus trituberculatus]